MIYVTGDLHGAEDSIWKFSTKHFKEMVKPEDYIIICGDFGMIWDGSAYERSLLDSFSNRVGTYLFVDGNHEAFPLINEYPVEQWNGGLIHKIRSSIFHLMRGQVFTIEGKKIFTMGGATSIDKEWRIPGVSWWPEEIPSKTEMELAFSNLEKNDWKVDYVCTHAAPDKIHDAVLRGKKYKPNDEVTAFLQEIDDKLEYKKDICSKLLNICYKLDNDYLEALNEDNNIPIPKLYIDKNMNYILQFDKYIDKAEFFIELDDRQQFYMEVDKCSFKTIDDRENCFKFNGKPGTIYSVYTFINQFRSVKYQFYVMINEEKEKYKNDLNEEVNRDEIDKIISSINEDYKDVDNFKDRAFMYSLKKISNPLIINPTIIDINKEEVIVKTNLNDFININYDKTFYLAIANYEDLIANKDIYKIEFRNIDDYIAISYLYHGIKTDTIYAIWIEDEDGVQISNPSTFIYNPNNKSNINLNTTYELKYILDDLLLAVNELSSDNRDSILAILNDTSLSPNELINEILFELSNLLISKQELINFIFNIKKYIGPLIDSNSSMLSNVSFNGTKLTFNSSYINSNLIIYNNDEIYNLTLKENNEIDITNYDNNIIYLLAVNNDISSKSNIVVINKAEKYMEVV